MWEKTREERNKNRAKTWKKKGEKMEKMEQEWQEDGKKK